MGRGRRKGEEGVVKGAEERGKGKGKEGMLGEEGEWHI